MTHTPAQTAEERAQALWEAVEETHTSQAKVALIASAITQAEDAAVARCREIVRKAKVDPEASAEHLRHLIVTALDPRWADLALPQISEGNAMSDDTTPESEVRIESLRDGGFLVYRGYQSPHSYNPPAKAVSTLGEVLHYVAIIMGPNASPPPTPITKQEP